MPQWLTRPRLLPRRPTSRQYLEVWTAATLSRQVNLHRISWSSQNMTDAMLPGMSEKSKLMFQSPFLFHQYFLGASTHLYRRLCSSVKLECKIAKNAWYHLKTDLVHNSRLSSLYSAWDWPDTARDTSARARNRSDRAWDGPHGARDRSRNE